MLTQASLWSGQDCSHCPLSVGFGHRVIYLFLYFPTDWRRRQKRESYPCHCAQLTSEAQWLFSKGEAFNQKSFDRWSHTSYSILMTSFSPGSFSFLFTKFFVHIGTEISFIVQKLLSITLRILYFPPTALYKTSSMALVASVSLTDL